MAQFGNDVVLMQEAGHFGTTLDGRALVGGALDNINGDEIHHRVLAREVVFDALQLIVSVI